MSPQQRDPAMDRCAQDDHRRRPRLAFRPFALVCVFALAGIFDASAQGASSAPSGSQPAQRTQTFQDWAYSCLPRNGVTACSIIQDHSGEDGIRTFAAEIRMEKDGTPTAILLLPFGLNLQAGVTTQIGSDPPSTPIPFRTCLPTGCVATFAIAKDQVQRMQAGSTMTVYLTSVSGERVNFAISLLGLTAALEKLTSASSG